MTIKASAQESTEQVAGKAREAVDKAEEYAREYASQADERVREAAARGRRRADDGLDRVSGYVRDNPLISMGIAFVVGALSSTLARRR